ncbi:hypothetical protein NA57DRAFT_77708 [Rhizodiscina lignyota]|uniref:ER membrane protein complex subunit 7 beta-sandwich domain-containing protein n=1 Tax=Rhizodiscina lignyota TaxID=1504668 RepID=A0A9P4M480_9PEZI|nr:hypothetical protein NA57DRAFT_77708 [Rhizodiscina lignyota]
MLKLFTLLSVLPVSLAALITVSIPNTPLVNPSSLPASTHATLDEHGVKLDAPITRANTFVFHNVSSGSYLLSVFCKDYAFENLRIDVTGEEERIEAWQTFRGNEWDNKGESRAGVVPGQVEVRPVVAKDYYQQRSGFSVLSFLKSPMILMALFSLVMIVGMPKLLENMDPEARAEFDEMQKTTGLGAASNPASAMQNFDLAGWMAGATSGSGSNTPAQQPEERGGKGGQRRRG